jgi:hypothetical protein
MDGGNESVASFSVKYDGAALADGEMQVRTFAPALLALEDLCEQANHLVNGDHTTASLRIKADLRRGSFEAIFSFVVSSIDLHQLITEVAAVVTSHTILGLIGLAKAKLPGLIPFTKFVNGGEIAETYQLGDGSTRVVVEHHHEHRHEIIVPDRVLDLFQKSEVQRNLRELTSPLAHDGIESIEMRENGTSVDLIKKSEVQAFSFPQLASEESTIEEAPVEKIYKATTITNKTTRMWRLKDGSTEITAYIKDETFLRRLIDHDIHCELGDNIRVRVQKKITRDAHGHETTKHYVVEILEVIPDEHHPTISGQTSLLGDEPTE